MKRAKQTQLRGPRNPLVAAVKFRKAGLHGKSQKAKRREENIAVLRDLAERED